MFRIWYMCHRNHFFVTPIFQIIRIKIGCLVPEAAVSVSFCVLCLDQERLQLFSALVDPSVRIRLQRLQLIQHGIDLIPDAGDSGLGPIDPVGNGPVGKAIRKPQKAVNADLQIDRDPNIGQLRFEPTEPALQFGNQLLGLIQMLMLDHMVDDAATAEDVPGIPASLRRADWPEAD